MLNEHPLLGKAIRLRTDREEVASGTAAVNQMGDCVTVGMIVGTPTVDVT